MNGSKAITRSDNIRLVCNGRSVSITYPYLQSDTKKCIKKQLEEEEDTTE